MNSKRIIVITGPSGAGKTTLIKKLSKECKVGIPKQTTTRCYRRDDDKNMYRYISIEKFVEDQERRKFAISSGKHERRYGFYKTDIMKAFEENDTLLLVASYKEIEQIQKMRVNINVVILTFRENIEKWVKKRLKEREQVYSEIDVEERAKYAVFEHDRYFEKLKRSSNMIVYTDESGIRTTVEMVKASLDLKPKNKEHIVFER